MKNPILSRLPIKKRAVLSFATLVVLSIPIAMGLTAGASATPAAMTHAVEMKHYRHDKWKFELDIPRAWIVEPPDPSNGPEVIRFHSPDPGPNGLIVWRSANYPTHSPKSLSIGAQRSLAKIGFSNFVSSETTIGSRQVQTLDFSQTLPDGSLMSCRHYFVIEGGVRYVLGFGTSSRDAMFATYDRMAKSFAFDKL